MAKKLKNMDLMTKHSKLAPKEPWLLKIVVMEMLSSLMMLKKEIFGECVKLNKTVLKIGLNLLLPELNMEQLKPFSG